jgi:hypothetical protein
MPQRATNDPAFPADEQVVAHIAAGLRAARARAGLSEEQVVDLVGGQGLEITARQLAAWEQTGLLRVDIAVYLAGVYGTTIDIMAGRRAFQLRHPGADLPPAKRSAW